MLASLASVVPCNKNSIEGDDEQRNKINAQFWPDNFLERTITTALLSPGLREIRCRAIFRRGSSLNFNRLLNVSVLHHLRVHRHALFSNHSAIALAETA